jgi:hypothetical protein
VRKSWIWKSGAVLQQRCQTKFQQVQLNESLI